MSYVPIYTSAKIDIGSQYLLVIKLNHQQVYIIYCHYSFTVLLSLLPYHVYSTLKRRADDRLYLVSTRNIGGVLVGLSLNIKIN